MRCQFIVQRSAAFVGHSVLLFIGIFLSSNGLILQESTFFFNNVFWRNYSLNWGTSVFAKLTKEQTTTQSRAVYPNRFLYFCILPNTVSWCPTYRTKTSIKGEDMWMTWSVLVVNLIPGYSISSEIWAICLYSWSYQQPTGIKRSALCWLLDQCMNARSYLRLWQLWTQRELSLRFHLLKRGHIQVGWDGKEALCAGTRQTSTHSW